MIGRGLIVVGCNGYDYMDVLEGAEGDAERVYNALMRPEIGEYDPKHSRILLSPTLSTLRDSIREVLFTGERLDTFTFFFAGHSGVKAGSFYMCLKDSRNDALSVSALSLSDFFLNISEAAPVQSNIIIDACESGGLITDLSVLLKPSVIGDAGTPGVTLLATSAQNQYSGETSEGGLGTNAILDCIEGREFIQDLASTLDLAEIGRHVSMRLRATGKQTPVVWGLNLSGPPRFCKNPRFGSDPTAPLRKVIESWPAVIDASIREHYDELWKVYASASGEWNPRSFANALTPILAPLAGTPIALVGFVDRLAATFLERATFSDDAFRPAQVGAALLGCLLRYNGKDLTARHTTALQQTVGEAINTAASILAERLDQDRYALLPRSGGGLSDLFFLPERIAKVLGWTGLAGLLLPTGSTERERADQLFTHLLRVILEQYSSSVVVMSDAQAPCWAIALSRTAELGLHDVGEQLVGLLYSSLADCGGQVADIDIPPAKVLAYLLRRHSDQLEADPALVARPSLTITVLLRAAGLFDLDGVFDDDLWRMDEITFGGFFNSNFEQFADERIANGDNALWRIGHDIFRVRELDATWPDAATRWPPTTALTASIAATSLVPLHRGIDGLIVTGTEGR